jgi:lipoprotein-anchoring transpeptidase ErfK/SrfK
MQVHSSYFSSQIPRPYIYLTAITFSFLLSIAFLVISSAPASAGAVRVKIDLSDQKMKVIVNGKTRHSWPVSTARRGYRTPVGSFKPTRMHRRYFSKKYHGSPLPHSIFFYGGYAIHGTNAIKRLGRPASHGCIRLHPQNARELFALVRNNGPRNTRITIQR